MGLRAFRSGLFLDYCRFLDLASFRLCIIGKHHAVWDISNQALFRVRCNYFLVDKREREERY